MNFRNLRSWGRVGSWRGWRSWGAWWGTRSACAGSGAGRTWCVITAQRLESVLGWNKQWRICIKPAAESLKPGAGSSTSSQQECWACPRPSIWAVCLLDQLITKYWIPEIDAKSKCISKLMRSRPVEGYHNASLFYTLILYSPKTPKYTFRRRKSITSGVLWRVDGLFSASIKVCNCRLGPHACGPNCWNVPHLLRILSSDPQKWNIIQFRRIFIYFEVHAIAFRVVFSVGNSIWNK